MTALTVTPIPAYTDNYIWAIHDQQHAVIIDPGAAQPVNDFLQQNKLSLKYILITHHHWDHVNGLESLQKQWGCSVFAPQDSRIPGVLKIVKENDRVELPELDLQFTVIETPGHTLSHICYTNDSYLFCGDTLFSLGCGRMFEGTPSQYVDSLWKIKSLPSNLMVYCTHEYTTSNIKFALSIEPNNEAILNKQTEVLSLRAQQLPSLPVALSAELELNPFLRTSDRDFQKYLATQYNAKIDDEVTCFAWLRKYKDHFQ